MLTGSLLRVRATREEIRPAYIDPQKPRYRERVALILERTHEARRHGRTRGELEEELEQEVVGTGVDHKLTRGLIHLLLQRCTFETRTPMDPQALRMRLFEQGPVARRAGPGERRTAEDCFRELAAELQCEPDEVRRGMFGDLDRNQVLVDCEVEDPDWLLHRYNVALVQGILVRANQVRVAVSTARPERIRQLFAHVKFRQLMYRVEKTASGFALELDGPASLFRLSTRYGVQLASFFPALPLQPDPWAVRARVKWRRLHRTLEVDHTQGLRSHLPDRGTWIPREAEWFEQRFRARERDWTLERGGALVPLGNQDALVPDYVLRRDGRRAWLEIVGMWRRNWLERRIHLVKEHGVPNLILAVSRNLLGDKGKALPRQRNVRLVPFARIIPVKDVLAAAEVCATGEEGGVEW